MYIFVLRNYLKHFNLNKAKIRYKYDMKNLNLQKKKSEMLTWYGV